MYPAVLGRRAGAGPGQGAARVSRSRGSDQAFATFINTWIDLKKKDGTLDSLYRYWILGQDPAGRPAALVRHSRRAALGGVGHDCQNL